MTRMGLRAFVMTLVFSAALAAGEVTVLYAPTSLDAGVATELTISVRDESGDGLGIGSIIFDFVVPSELDISDFVWLSGLDNADDYLATNILPDLAQTIVLVGSTGVQVPPGGTLAIASIVVTASESASGTTLTLAPFPESRPNAGIYEDVLFEAQVFTGGREIDLSVSGEPVDDGGAAGNNSDGGDSDDGSGDGGDSGTQDPPDVPDDDGEDEPIDEEESDQNPADEDETGDLVVIDPDESDDDAVDDPTNDNGSSPGPTDENDGDDESSEVGDTSVAPTVQESGNTGTNSSGPRSGTGFCGLGMISTGLFTLMGLSVMKFHRRRLLS